MVLWMTVCRTGGLHCPAQPPYISIWSVVSAQKDPVLASKFKCAGALALIDSKKYQQAARKLTEVRPCPARIHCLQRSL